MKDMIIISGAAGTGKTTLSEKIIGSRSFYAFRDYKSFIKRKSGRVNLNDNIYDYDYLLFDAVSLKDFLTDDFKAFVTSKVRPAIIITTTDENVKKLIPKREYIRFIELN